MTAVATPFSDEQVKILPVNEASWNDLTTIFGTRDYPAMCQCQHYKVVGWIWRDSTREQRTAMRLRLGGDLLHRAEGLPGAWPHREVTHPTARRVVMRIDFE
jgi:hypothetical protein